jgi:alkaline phosphatase D
MKPIALAVFLMSPLIAAEFRSDWQGTRQWIGPEYWAGPLYDWKTEDGAVIAVAAKDRLLHLLSHRPLQPEKGFQMRVKVELLHEGRLANPASVRAGLAVGVKGMMDDARHVAVWPKQRIEAVVRADGRLALGLEAVSEEILTGHGPVELELTTNEGSLKLKASRNGRSATVSMPVKPEDLTGNLCLTATSPRQANDKRGDIRARFQDWHIEGEAIGSTGVEPSGPILWSQYTRQGNKLNLSAQIAPMGDADAEKPKPGDQFDGFPQTTRFGGVMRLL